jgi:hypothetical protein
MTNLSEKSVTLNAQDRCDACGAQAFVRAEFLNGELLFCGHHWRVHEASATAKVIRVDDFTDTINAKPGVSVN